MFVVNFTIVAIKIATERQTKKKRF